MNKFTILACRNNQCAFDQILFNQKDSVHQIINKRGRIVVSSGIAFSCKRHGFICSTQIETSLQNGSYLLVLAQTASDQTQSGKIQRGE